jgi:phosphate transport system substrate-binding protein
VQVNYNPIGSGAGIAAVSGRSVDFGASDAPLTPDQATACHGCLTIPWALSATAIAYQGNGLPPNLRITGPMIADIYLGKITRWNDPRIQGLNKKVSLPSTQITPIYRSDSSGTTYNFTDYLASASAVWKTTIGIGTQVSFPVGVGGAKSSGVSGVLSKTDGGIAYVDVAYALKNHFHFFKVKNAAGIYQLPGLRGQAAAASTITKVTSVDHLSIVNPPKTNSAAYPICTFTFVIVPTSSSKAIELRRFFNWAVTKGQSKIYTAKLLYSPLPKPVVKAAQAEIAKIQAS